MTEIGTYKYSLQVKEHYIIKTELTKNRTHQTYKWKEVALGITREDLEPLMAGLNKNNWRIIER